MSMRIITRVLVILLNVIMGSFNLFAVQELSIGQSENVYLNPSLPSGAWITSASWTTDVIGLECSYSGEWGTHVTAYGYWDNVATVSCFYTYSYYGADNKIHVSHGDAYYYFTCKGYPVTLSPTSVNLDPGETATLTFSISGASIGQIAPRWESSNTSVATVYESGTYSARVTAKQPGTCIITCYSYMGKPVTCSVKVNSIQPTSISIDPSKTTLTVDQTISLKCVFTPSYASSSVTWKSQNSSIASISSVGTVTGNKAGKTTVTATTSNGLTAQCSITVTDKYVNPRGPVSKSLDGAGTSSNPYKIKTAADLRYLADKVNSGTDFRGKYFLQTADIVINPYEYDSEKFKSGEVWIPIGDIANPFRGNYDGGNHIISGILITDNFDLPEINSRKSLGLFGLIGTYTTICNVTLTNSLYDLSSSNQCESLAGFVGNVEGYVQTNSYTNFSELTNCHIKNSQIKGTDIKYISGIVGGTISISNGIIINKCSNGAIIYGYGESYIGGITSVNFITNKTISNCINYGNITYDKGFAAGISFRSGSVANCCNCGNINNINSQTGFASGVAYLISEGNTEVFKNCVNYGKIDGYKVAAVLKNDIRVETTMTLINNVYEETYPLYYSQKNPYFNDRNNHKCTWQELSSDAIISILNSNLQSGWCRWIKGKNGYPILDYFADLSGIDEITIESSFDDLDLTLPYEVYDMQGLMISDSIETLAPGIYIVRQGLSTKKIIVR